MVDMGGIKFFCVTMEKCLGEMSLVEKAIEGANKVVDEEADDRKGGAGDIGKIFLSANDQRCAVIAHVPKALGKEKDLVLKEWVEATVAGLDAIYIDESEEIIKLELPANPEKERFPLKMRDLAINQGFAYLKMKQLVLDESSSDGDINYAEAAGIEW
jgi:hypothetical protein